MCKNVKWQDWPLAPSHHLATKKVQQPGLLCVFCIEATNTERILVHSPFTYLTFALHPSGLLLQFVFIPPFMSCLFDFFSFFFITQPCRELFPRALAHSARNPLEYFLLVCLEDTLLILMKVITFVIGRYPCPLPSFTLTTFTASLKMVEDREGEMCRIAIY